jgi:dolichol-phosphate mannosyltransferase
VIPELVERLRGALSHSMQQKWIRAYELIFVNDASTDGSLNLLMKLNEGHGDIRIVNMSRNFGVSPCVLAGFKYAKGDVVVYMDADLQDPPEVIPELLKIWSEQKVDVVHSVRTRREGEGFVKLAVTRLGYAILRRVSSIDLAANAGDFKLLSRRVVDHILNLKEQRPFMRGLVTWVGFSNATHFYKRDARAAGETKFPIFSYSVISNFLDSALISFSDMPLKLISLLGLTFSLISFGLLIYVVINKFMGNNIPGWSALMVTISFFSGIQLMALGGVGLYINAIFNDTKRRPLYIVDSVYGFENHP